MQGTETYQALRTFADSWGLLFMTLVFLFVVIRTLMPGREAIHDDAAQAPFRNDK